MKRIDYVMEHCKDRLVGKDREYIKSVMCPFSYIEGLDNNCPTVPKDNEIRACDYCWNMETPIGLVEEENEI